MKQNNKNVNQELYTYTEFRETFFPNLKLDDDIENHFTRESLLEFLKTTTPPIESQRRRRRDKKDK
jgi:hypothetical protein